MPEQETHFAIQYRNRNVVEWTDDESYINIPTAAQALELLKRLRSENSRWRFRCIKVITTMTDKESNRLAEEETEDASFEPGPVYAEIEIFQNMSAAPYMTHLLIWVDLEDHGGLISAVGHRGKDEVWYYYPDTGDGEVNVIGRVVAWAYPIANEELMPYIIHS